VSPSSRAIRLRTRPHKPTAAALPGSGSYFPRPRWFCYGGPAAMRRCVFKQAVEKAGTDDRGAVTEALEGITLESSAYRNPVGGHRAITNVPWGVGKEAKSPKAARK
jgi:hypothetical protein